MANTLVNLSDNNIRGLEQTDEILLSKILDCNANTSNIFKYLELGVYPIRFEIMKRKVVFLQYILKQEESSMMYKVFQATCDQPIKKDFVQTYQKFLECLDIDLKFDEIKEMSEYRFKSIVKQKTVEASFKYLMDQKNKPGKHTKIENITYKKLCIQEYLLDGNQNTELARVIYKARGRTLNIKEHKKWKYSDNTCVGCSVRSETENELLSCPGFGEEGEGLTYSSVFEDNVNVMFNVAKEIRRRLKIRDKILEQENG